MNMEDMKIKEMISAYIDGELSGEEKEICEEHLTRSKQWQDYYRELKGLEKVLVSLPGDELSPDGEQNIRSRVMKQESKEGIAVEPKRSKLKIRITGGLAVALVAACVVAVLLPNMRQAREKAKSTRFELDGRSTQFGHVPDKITSAIKSEERIAPVGALEAKNKAIADAASPAVFPNKTVTRYYGLRYGLLESDSESWRYNPQFHTEEYDRIYDNEFKTVEENPLSTFSIDVDTASYSNVRRFLAGGQLPPEDAVRIEEMINYFSYDYPQPGGSVPFSVTLNGAACPWNAKHQLVRIGLQGKSLKSAEVPPSNLVFLIDVSGSMDSEDKLGLLKSAFKMLVNQLSDDEKVAIVVYAGSAGLVLDSTPGDDKQQILSAIDRLQAGGSTAGGAGINLAYRIAAENLIPGGNNRVILATDGDFNVGVSSDAELVRIIEEKRKEGVFLTILGFGAGNYKDSKMEQLADKGNGNYFYIDTIREAKKVLVEELGSTLFTIAKDVKIQVEFNPANVKAYRLVGYENRILAKEDFNDDTKDAGEIGAGHTVTALYEIVPAGSEESFRNVDELKYQKKEAVPSSEVMTVKLRYKEPDEDKSKLIAEVISKEDFTAGLSGDFQFAAAVAEFGMLLRNSKFKADSTYAHVIESAENSKGKDTYGYREELIGLVKKAQGLDTRTESPTGPGQIKFKGE